MKQQRKNGSKGKRRKSSNKNERLIKIALIIVVIIFAFIVYKIFDIYESFVHDNSNHPNYVEKITDMIEENVIPRYNDLQSLKTYINTSDTLKVFGESVDDFIYCDRILKNDKTINKRFDMKSFIESNSNMDLDEMVRSLCEFIDTYDISTEAKYNIALENITFMLLSKDKTLDESVIQNHITDYFLMRESVMTDFL